ncbi:hypothetical protein Efla_000649 [Eimeria flavescens]
MRALFRGAAADSAGCLLGEGEVTSLQQGNLCWQSPWDRLVLPSLAARAAACLVPQQRPVCSHVSPLPLPLPSEQTLVMRRTAGAAAAASQKEKKKQTNSKLFLSVIPSIGTRRRQGRESLMLRRKHCFLLLEGPKALTTHYPLLGSSSGI